MRVALVIHGFPPANMTGSEVYTYNLAVELATRHEVFVFHRVAAPESEELAVEKKQYKGLNITTINNNFKCGPEFSKTYKNELIAKKFGEFLDEVSPDVVHFHHVTCLSTTCVKEARARNIPVVYTLHDFWLFCQRGQLLNRELSLCVGPSDERCAECLSAQLAMSGKAGKAASTLKKTMPRFKGSATAKELLRKVFLFSSKTMQKDNNHGTNEISKRTQHILEICSMIDAFIAPSRFLKGKYMDFGIAKEKITYLDYGFDKSIFEGIERKPSQKIRFGYIGSWIPSKGVHVLIKAFNRVNEKNAELTIYGEPLPYHGYKDYNTNLKGLVKNKAIKLAGPYDNKDVGTILSGIDVLIVPSIWYENSPLTIHEAYLAGIPVIASNIGGMAEYVGKGNGGINFKVGDDEDLSRVIEEVITNPALLKEMRESIPPVKSIADNAVEIEEIYRDITAPTVAEGYDFIRNIFKAEVRKEGKGYTECPYAAYKLKNMVNVSAFKAAGEERPVLFAHPAICVGDTSTTVEFRGITINKGDTMDFGIGINEAAWIEPGDGVEFELLLRVDNEYKTLFKRYIDPKSIETDRRWFDESLDLSAFKGKAVEVLFKTSAGPRNDPEFDWSGWSSPVIKNNGEIKYNFLEHLKKSFIIRFEKENPNREEVFYLGDDARQVVSMDKESHFIYSGVHVPVDGRLNMGVGVRGGPRGISLKGGLQVSVVRKDGTTEDIFSKNALSTLGKRLTKRAWHDVDIDISHYGGEEVDFHFRNKSGLVMGLGPLEIVSKLKKKIKPRSVSQTNVLIITLDAVRADHLGFMGNKTVKTPCLDRMAAEGVVFKNHFAQSHITIPSHVSMLASKFPRTINTMDNYKYNFPVLNTIPERLGKEGYRCSAVVSAALLNPEWCRGIERGFGDYFPVLGMERAGSQCVNILSDWISADREKPFFSWIHIFDAHFPYQAPKPFHKMYAAGTGKDSKAVDSVEMHALTKNWLTQKGITDVDLPISEYGAEITYLDYELDRLFKHMEALGVLDNTLIMITADHGEYLGERGNYFCHVGVFDETMRIPLIIRLPEKLPAGEVVEGMSMNIDLVPTALEILGLKGDGLEGSSLMPLIEKKAEEVHEYVIDEGAHGSQIAIRTTKWKFIKTLEDVSYSPGFKLKKGLTELYDLVNDPGETTNAAKENSAVTAGFETLLSKWLAERRGGEEAEMIEADEETKQKLEALGYL
ncbi:MAG: sulfatase-like hydrolase/transferase [Thermodesulfobacteriota bacterium]